MKFAVINTAGPAVEVALSGGSYFRNEDGRCASAELMPSLDKLLTEAKTTLRELDYIACVTGPGSFTGIRIGVSSARSLCYACNLPAVGIHYLKMLAYNERADGYERILVVTDGSNGTAYVCEFDGNRGFISQCVCVPQSEAIDTAQSYKGVVCTDGRMHELLPDSVPPSSDCSTLIRAAEALRGNTCKWNELIPEYVRESQAERELKAREQGGIS